MKARGLITLGLVLGLGALVSGCSSAQKGVAAGGVIGGAAGAMYGHNVNQFGMQTGAAIGGGSGAAVGGLAGDAYDQITEADKERELENLRAQLKDRETELASHRAAGMPPEKLAEIEQMKNDLETAKTELESARASLGEKSTALETTSAELAARKAAIEELNARVMAAGMTLEQAQKERQEAELAKASLEAESARLRNEIAARENELNDIRSQKAVLQTSLADNSEEIARLRSELSEMNVQLEETAQGLNLTIAEQLLYKAGKAELTPEGKKLIGRVAGVIQNRFPGREIVVEGHTDNQPIVRSNWKSNWELGAARSLSVVHQLVSDHKFDPTKVSAVSYGEFRPTASNANTDGRRANRRAVIVILPEKLTITKEQLAAK